MGKSISYCYKCSSLLREDDFLKGKAFQDGNRVVCAKCAPGLRESSTTKIPSKPASTKISSRGTSTRLASVKKPIPPDPEDFEGPPRSRLPLILGISGGGAALLGILLFFVLRKDSPLPAVAPPPEPEKVARPNPATKDPPKKVERTADQELLDTARKFASEHPDDLNGQKDRFEKVVWDFERTASAVDAKKEIEAIKLRISEKVQAGMAQLDEEIKELLARESFGAAIKVVDEAGKRLPLAEWPLATSKRSREIYESAKARCEELSKLAEALTAQGKGAEAQALVTRVRGWELPRLLAAIEEAAGPAAPPKTEDGVKSALPVAKPRSAEGKAYLAIWEKAMVRVAARDYAGALGELQGAAAGLKEPEVAAEAKADLEDLKRLEPLVRDAIAESVAKPPGWMSFEVRDGRKGSGRVLQIDGDRVEVAGKTSSFAEWSEMTAATITALPRKEKPEARLLALFCLAEGDLEPAKALLGTSLDAVSAKYWAWAPEARSKIPKAEPIEVAARELYYSAEREYRSMSTRGLSVEKYKSLRKDYAASTLVRRLADRIDRRGEACKEYYFAGADFERAGTLKLNKAGKLESDADTDPNFANQNWAEIEYYILPGTPYRAWMQIGGCCQGCVTFLWQATDLTTTDPRTKKSAPADIGSRFAPEVRPSIRGLKPAHDPKTPKAPLRWEWIELPIPKYSAPGPKRVRIMTDQKGFAIGGLVVSSGRKAPPKEDEVKELEAARVAEVPPVRIDPDLVVWYTLDDGAGAAVADLAGGHKAAVTGTPRWVAGKLGGALEFDGQSHVSSPDAPDLRLTGDITIAFWLNKKSPGGDWQRMVGKGTLALRAYGCWIGGGSEKVLFQQYNAEGQAIINFTTVKEIQLGKWHHFAATVQGTKATVYLDGVKEAEGTRTGVPATSDDPLLLGWANVHDHFIGALDDVRIYKRGLSAEEVRDLFELAR